MKQRVLFIVAIFIAWLPVFMIQKPLFMAYHHQLASSCLLADYLQVILHGLKLDCTISGYLTAIPLLLTLGSIWLPGIWLRKLLSGYFFIMAILIAAIFSIDVALYGFWGFRLDATVLFYLQSPKDAMASVPVGLFILQFIFFLVYTYIIYWFFRKCILAWTPETMVRKRITGTVIFLLMGGILFIPIRGGVTTSTANVGMVYFSRNQFLNHSAINPCFSLLASLSKQQDFATQFDFFPEDRRAELMKSLYPSQGVVQTSDSTCTEKTKLLTTNRPNILIILMESFSANVVGAVGGEKDVTTNIDRLSKEGILFTNMYANSFRTDRGIVSVLNGYLAQPTTSIMKYPAKSQTLPSIAKSLNKENYTADMLYGGDINFTNMQSYFFSSGYNKITADRDFPLSSRLSKWGTNDDITFSWLYDNIKGRDTEKPWLTTFLTLSSHEPFEVPFHHLDHPYLNSVAFTDSCLGSFIDKMKQLPAWKNTLVVLVADHGFRYPEDLKDFEPRRFHIPMLWLGGAIKEPMVIDKYANQTDFAATLLSQLDLPHEEFTFSKDLFNPDYPAYAFYTFTNGFGFIDNTGYSVYDNESNKALMESSADSNSETRLNKGKALLQTLYDDLGSR
ncbi:LTA synthase family protein [Parabacteroides bouchesdurhonensis]|uniref:LTA synthase family protein n=1 Tax=Parabacteroides bouchesdurhonensis TaxID=1936995 RepID=UPI000E504EBF|nr:LTA synthase family protein [Parabacteroides bouchesdurhonensis]RHJ92471.1 LTA synthase family protein [Bacteroides sp. AM07-16]